MKKKKLTSLTVALGIGVMLSPAVASAQEEIGSQPGTETPVDSAEEEPTASESAGVQPGTEAPQAEGISRVRTGKTLPYLHFLIRVGTFSSICTKGESGFSTL